MALHTFWHYFSEALLYTFVSSFIEETKIPPKTGIYMVLWQGWDL